MKKKNSSHKSPAQAMVEFAITLPILLMLLYGILEAGRMLFLYSTVVTASRQAVRYGTATSSGGDFTSQGGPDNSTYFRYQDCYGIRAAANRAGFLGQFDTIDMEFDTGPSTTVTPHCTGGSNFDTDLSPTSNIYRLSVTVSEQFTPLVPKLVPFLNRTFTATSARTILYSVDIEVTAPPGSYGGNVGEISLEILSPGVYSFAGESIAFTYRVTNTGTIGDIDISALTITTDRGSATCSSPPSAFGQGATFDCTGTYTVTQADVDAGFFDNNATATAGIRSADDLETLITTPTPVLTLDKTSDTDASAVVGTVITYTYTLTNAGNVTLGPPYTIDDNKINDNDITCPSTGDITPGNSTQCTGTYQIKNPDINAGTIVNVATGTADTVEASPQTITSNSDSVTVYTPALYLNVSASPATATTAGQAIDYIYTLQNISDSNMRSPYTVYDSRVSSVTCPAGPATMTPGTVVTCTGTYTVTQNDLDTGSALTSSVYATARKATGSQLNTSNTRTVSVGVTQAPALNLALLVNPATATTLNDLVTYTYTLTNNGNVTLSPAFTITDDKASGITCADPGTAIAPGGTKTCTGTRTISQTDLDDGSVTNNATASATLGAATISSNSVSATVTTYIGARLTLVITANPNPASGSGTIITFTYTLRNTGNVVLSAPYSVTSTLTGAVDCSAASATIPVGGSTTCIGFYTTQPGDPGTSITDSATATAMDGASTVTSNNATLIVPVNP